MTPGGDDAARRSGAGLAHRRRAAGARQEFASGLSVHAGAGAINERVRQSFYRATLLHADGTDGVQSPACPDLETAFVWAHRFLRIARSAGDQGASAVVEFVRVRRLGVLG